MPRIHHPAPLQPGQTLLLTAAGARHVQVLRLQPGDALTLFGDPVVGGEYAATVTRMGRSDVEVVVGAHQPLDRSPARVVHLVVGMPANERMDWLVEKATELGVASIQPVMTERSVLRLKGERAEKKTAHWQAVAVAACEQCGGNRVPPIHPVAELQTWTRTPCWPERAGRALLSLADGARPWAHALPPAPAQPLWLVIGPEGGLSPAEDQRLRALGFEPVSLGPRVLRTETAALAALAQVL